MITLKNGEQLSGIFSGASVEPHDARYTLKMVKRLRGPTGQQVNGSPQASDEYIGEGDEHVLSVVIQDTVDLSVTNVDLQSSESKAVNGKKCRTFRHAQIMG